MTHLHALIRWVSLLGTEHVADAVVLETIVLRNLTFAVVVVGAMFTVPAIFVAGAPFVAALISLSGAAAVVSLLLAAAGHGRAAALVTLTVLNVGVSIAVVRQGSSGLEAGHLLSVTLPFTLFEARDRKLMLLAVLLALMGAAVAKLPVWPLAAPTDADPFIRLTSMLGAAGVVIGQLWLFSWVRTRTTTRLEQALETTTVAHEAKSAFVASMTHDSRTSIQGVLQRLDELQQMPLAPEEREYASIARVSAQSLLDIVDDVLDLSRLERGTLQVDERAIDLRHTVEEVLDRATAEADPKGVELRMRYGPDVPHAVHMDSDRVRQVLLNLVNNAVAFTHEGHVEVAVRQIRAEGDRMILELSVEDTGIGIPEDAQAKVFETFEQVDTSLTRTHEGVGLGLSICRGLVKAMGGELGMSSEPGKGSRFWFSLPVRCPPPEER